MIHEIITEKLSREKFVDRVRYFSYQKYEDAIKSYLNFIPLKEIEAVYQIGSIKNPGISDIDLLVIFKNAKRDSLEKYSISRLNKDERYLFGHNPLFLDEATFQELNSWFSYFSLQNLYGDKINLNCSKREENISLIILTQYLITKLPHDLFRYGFINNKFYERSMLTQMNSLRYTILLSEEVFKNIPQEWRTFSSEYENFRHSWFEKNEKEKIDGIGYFYSQAFKICSDLANRTSDYIEKNILENPIKCNFLFKPFGRLTICFKKEWTGKDWLRCLSFYKKRSSQTLKFSLPLNLSCFLLSWANSKYLIGKHISRCLTNREKIILTPEIDKTFRINSKVINDYFKFHITKFKKAPSEYYVYWAPAYKLKLVRLFYGLLNKINLYI